MASEDALLKDVLWMSESSTLILNASMSAVRLRAETALEDEASDPDEMVAPTTMLAVLGVFFDFCLILSLREIGTSGWPGWTFR